MYEFSAPLPTKTEHIDKIIAINKKIEKSKITNLYFALPGNCPDASGFEQIRVRYKAKTDLEHWEKLIAYAIENGFDFVYLINTPKAVTDIDKILEIQLEKLDILIQRLKKLGCTKLRISNTQILDYVLKHYPDIEVYASTSFEHTQLRQYKIFLEMYPQIKEIVPSFEVNKNFTLLKNLRKLCKNTDIELMVNEGCLSGCPIRTHHNLSNPYMMSEKYMDRDISLTYRLFNLKCTEFINNNYYDCLCKTNVILPWEIEKYAKIGINKFKLIGRNTVLFFNGEYIDFYDIYLSGIDNIKQIEDKPYRTLNHAICHTDFPLTVKEIREYLPKIEHFIKNGHLCASICGNECNYCFECAKRLEKYVQNRK